MSAASNKRRKTNSYQSSPQKVRSLDFFFGKQVQSDTGAISGQKGDVAGKQTEVAEKEVDATEIGAGQEQESLSDEALARKLQAEWDAQDRQQEDPSTSRPEKTQETGPLQGELKQIHDSGDTPAPLIENAQTAQEAALAQEQEQEKPAPANAFAMFGSKKNTLSLQSATADNDSTTYEIPFDESPLTFDPQKYIPALQKQWTAEGGIATYSLLTHCFILVNATTSRIKIVDTLTNTLRVIIEASPSSLLPAVWLATNSISPPYIDLELGLGGSAISKALKKVCGLDNPGLKKLYDKHGDAGDVAFEAKKRQSLTLRKPKPLTIKSVYDSLHKIATAKGTGSVEVKQRIVERLVQDARGAEESRYIVRTLVQHLRIGAVKTTMLIALSRAFLLSRPPDADFPIKDRAQLAKLSKQELAEVYAPAEELVKACFARRPNYNDLVPTLLEIGVSQEELLLRCGLSMHIPLRPMLGGITRDLGEMLSKLEGRNFTCEYKYDGQRAQVHCDAKGKVTIFSRHLEVMTDKYPDLVALVPQIRGEGVSSFIIEGEVVAIDKETGELKPFQVLSNRARKDVVIGSVKVDVCLYAFDLMYLNGEELLGRPLRERRSLLKSLFVESPRHFTWVKNLDATSADEEAISEFFKQAIADKCEGLMAKVLDNLPEADIGTPPLEADQLLTGTNSTEPKAPPTPSKRKAKAKVKVTSKQPPGESDTIDEASALGDLKKAPSSRRKALLATYEPDKRLDSWLKVKKDYNTTTPNAFAETIDLIPVAGWHGQGRKSKWWSPILLAARNPETGGLEAVTKCMSGFTDKFYKANRERYAPETMDGAGSHNDDDDDDPEDDDNDDNDEEDEEEHESYHTRPSGKTTGGSNVISKPSYISYNAGHPAVWFAPQEVWEISFADITLSPTYTAALGLVSEGRGLSLRFPRFIKVREDKGIDEASTVDFLASLYRRQEGVGKASAAGGDGGGAASKKEEEDGMDGDGDEDEE